MLSSGQKILYVFPGQGSQYKGIGSDLYQEYPVVRKVYDQASRVLGYDIAELCPFETGAKPSWTEIMDLSNKGPVGHLVLDGLGANLQTGGQFGDSEIFFGHYALFAHHQQTITFSPYMVLASVMG